jgi:hypothetical protein
MKVKPGMESKLGEIYKEVQIPGHVNTFVYRMDANPNELYLAVVFDSKESYTKNADDPAQDARYRQMLEVLDGEPEWHDGEIVYSM